MFGYKNAKLFGHPIHSMLVHFPSALLPVSLIFDFMASLLNISGLAEAAFYTLAAGLLGGFFASIFGAIDFYQLSSTDKAWNKAGLHALLSIVWLCLFLILFGLRAQTYPHINFASPGYLIFSTIGILGLLFSNFLGGDLVFRHKIGIIQNKE